MAKIKKILSRDESKSLETQEKTRAEHRELLKAELRKAESFVAPDGSADVTNREQQMGRPLSHREIMKRLIRCNSALRYEQSRNWPDQGGIYFGPQFICGIPHGIVSEFSVPLVSEDQVPDPDIPLQWRKSPKLEQHIPGWRSILLRLIMAGFITPSEAEREFQITRGRSSQKWQNALN